MASGISKGPSISIRTRNDSGDSQKSPRVARFVEATSVDSPIGAPVGGFRFNETPYTPVESCKPQLQAGDIGFGYINDRRSMAEVPHVEMPASEHDIQALPVSPGPKSPLKSAMKSPRIEKPARLDLPMKSPTFQQPLKSPLFQEEAILSPTWREEKLLEKRETRTSKRQQEDLRVKVRVRMAKLILRFTNFSCSLIVLAMVGTVITVFDASSKLPPRNSLPPWAPGTARWPQITVLCISCVSLFFSIAILIAYCKKGKKRAEKWAAYYSIMAVGFFGVSIVMWATGASILQTSKNNGDGKDMWGWTCKQNTRAKIFQTDVDYKKLCRLQNWSLVCCIIEVVVEVITILVYGIVFYRYWSKRKLTKTMAIRDKARSQLYMSQMKSPSNPYFPQSPGAAGPSSPREGGYNPMYSPRFAPGNRDVTDAAEKGQIMPDPSTQFTSLAGALAPAPPKFTLSKPPTKSPKVTQKSFGSSASSPDSPKPPTIPSVTVNEHVEAAPGEQQYGTVPIPGAYASPVQSPTNAPPGGFQSMQG